MHTSRCHAIATPLPSASRAGRPSDAITDSWNGVRFAPSVANQSSGATLRIGTPDEWRHLPPGIVGLDATPDRQRFLAILPERTGPQWFSVEPDWGRAIPDR